jgi:hypothetical protein
MALTIASCRYLGAVCLALAMPLAGEPVRDISSHIGRPRDVSAPERFDFETLRALVRLLCASGSIQELQTLVAGFPEVRTTRAWIRYAGREVTGWRVMLTLEDGWLILRGRGEVGCPAEIRWCPRTWCRMP